MSSETAPLNVLAPAKVASSSRCSILVVGWSAPPYNGMSTATELALRTLSDDFEIVFLDIADKRDLSNIGRFEIGNILLAIKHGVQFCHLLLKKKPTIVYIAIAQQWLPFLRDCLFLIPSRLAGRKVVIHLHGGLFGEFWASSGRVMRSVMRLALGRAACVIVLGERLRPLFDGVVPLERVTAIPNGIPDWRGGRIERRSGSPVMLYLGALMKSKGVLELISIVPAVRERIPGAQLVLTGEWLSKDDEAEAIEMIHRNDLKDCVHFTGPKGSPEKYEIYRSADIFVMPTFYPNEGHPYTILEAMCAGLPVVSTDVSCIPETVIDGETGYVVAKHDTSALTERIVDLLEDRDLRVRMGSAGRRRFEEHYTSDRFKRQFRSAFFAVRDM